MPLLYELEIELSGTCNIACSYCTWTNRATGKTIMDTVLALELIDEAAEFNPPPLVTLHSVGESTLHPDLLRVLRRADDKKLQTRLSTNCTRLTGKLAQELAASPRLEMILAIHEGIPKKTFDQCVDHALDYLSRKPINRIVQVLSVCSEDNSLSPLWFCETFITLIEQIPQARLFFKQPQTWPRSAPIRGIIPNVPSHPQIIIDCVQTPRSLGRGCDMPNYFLNVQADGTITPCCVGQEDWKLADRKHVTLHEAWESERMTEIRRLWQKADDSLPCGHCLKRTDC